MKSLKILLATACVTMGFNSMSAQTTIYDANRLLGSDLNGTARYVGMGGAMGALGGDITTMSTNPAGIGIYRSSDVMISFGLANNGMKTDFLGKTDSNDKFVGSFDTAGFVYSYKVGNHTPIRFVNFGFNYRRVKNYDRNMLVSGAYNASQTEQMADMTNNSGASVSELQAKGAYANQYLPWLGILGYDSYLIDPWYKDGSLAGYDSFYQNGDVVDGVYRSTERGGLNAFDFNLALNVNDRVYIGATLGAYYLDYTRRSTYDEDFTYYDNNVGVPFGGYTLDNYYHTSGSGFDFKLGFIIRPFETSPFRFGAAVHTPTLYRLTEYGSATINYDVDIYNAEKGVYEAKQGTVFTQDQNGNQWQSETQYKVVSPWRYNLSLGYTVGTIAAIGVEYEYADYSTTKLKYDDNVTMESETQDARDMLKGVHTFKIGAEIKVAPTFAIRAGYNHITAAMHENAFKWLPSNSVRTDTEYSNFNATNNYTLGLGYRGNFFYADLAYQFNTYKEDFYAFENQYLTKTEVTNKNNRVVMTLGVRF